MEKELIKKARRVNLGEYLLYRGEPLRRDGRRYRHKNHDSLVFTDNSFYWNARSEKGNSIDFLMLFYQMDFMTAVGELLDYMNISPETNLTPQQTGEFRFSDLRLDISTARAVRYLSDIRKINRKLILHLVEHCCIFQEYGTRNIVFPMYDEGHKAVGAEIHGSTEDGRFKGISRNSKYGYGFNLVYGKPEHIYFFESAIDLISFIEVLLTYNVPLEKKGFVSMGGLKENVVKHMSEVYCGRIVLCVDNDEAGRIFSDKLQNTFPERMELYSPASKDWNEYLRNRKVPESKS